MGGLAVPNVTNHPSTARVPTSYFHFTPNRGTEYCDEHVCVSVRSHISKTLVQTSQNFLHVLPLLGPPVTTLQYIIHFLFARSAV